MTKTMLLLMLLSSGADLATTEHGLAHGARELNPLMQSRSVRIATSFGVPVAAYLLTRDKPRAAKWVCIIHVSVHGAAAARNVYVGATITWGGSNGGKTRLSRKGG